MSTMMKVKKKMKKMMMMMVLVMVMVMKKIVMKTMMTMRMMTADQFQHEHSKAQLTQQENARLSGHCCVQLSRMKKGQGTAMSCVGQPTGRTFLREGSGCSSLAQPYTPKPL